MPALPERPIIETKRLVMRLIEQADMPALFAVNGDPEVMRYTPHTGWKSQADADAWFGRVLENRRTGAGLQLVIALRDGGEVVGTMVLFHFNDGAKSGEVGYALAKEHWGKGYAKEALGAFVEFCFEVLGLERIEAQIDPRNEVSAKLLEKAGFMKEGHQRRNFHAKGETSDTGLYGMLSTDPRPRL